VSYFRDPQDLTSFAHLRAFANGLYECQRSALLAVQAHFSTSSRPAIVSMPAGSGKTEVMIALASGPQARRVPAIEPATVLRRQTADRFEGMRVFRQLGIVSDDLDPSRTHCVQHICEAAESRLTNT